MASRFQRLAIEIKQTKSVLADFIKSKNKCMAMSEQLQEPIPSGNWKQFQDLERQVQIKIRILDQSGLVSLKNRITSALSQILDIEHQLNFKYQRKKARNQHINNNYASESNYRQKQREKANVQIDSHDQRGQRHKTKIKQANSPKQEKSKPRDQLPFYVMKNDTVENKLDSISKFVASLKKNMKKHAENTGQFKLKQFLMGQPQHMRIRQQLERYKMKAEEQQQVFQRRVQQEIQKYISKCQIIEQTNDFKIIKIKKEQKRQMQQKAQSLQNRNTIDDYNTNILTELGVTYQQCQQDKVDINQVRRRVDEDFEDIKRRLQENGDNLEGIFEKINQTVGESQQKLRQLRGKRKKMFIDDDIWDQMEKM